MSKLTVKAWIAEIKETEKRFTRVFHLVDRIGMPWISDTGNDFGLENQIQNQKKLKIYLEQETEVLEEDENYKFFLAGNWDNFGYLVKYDKKENLIVYLCKFEVSQGTQLFPHLVTQTEVWRALKEMPGIAKRVFFDILYPKFGAILSDRIHTERGKEFWISCLKEADRKGLGIGFKYDNPVFLKPKDMSLENFFQELNTWPRGAENKERGMAIQFLICNPSYTN